MAQPEKFEIFYIRHAHTQGPAPKGFSECDVPLSPLGERQLPLLAKRFEGASFDAVYVSPLIRALITAGAFTSLLKTPVPLILMPEIIEKGAWKTYKGIALDKLLPYNNHIVLCPDKISDGEGFYDDTDEALTRRAQAVLGYFREKHTYGQRIAVVSHGSFGNHFLGAALGIGTPDFIFSQNNTAVSKLKYTDDGNVRLSFCNDMSHLRPLEEAYEFTV